MNNLEELRKIKEEVNNMPFSYENVHRIMHLVYVSKELFQASTPVPNKEIALHQINRISENDFNEIIKSNDSKNLKAAFGNLQNNFNVALNYI